MGATPPKPELRAVMWLQALKEKFEHSLLQGHGLCVVKSCA
jgi:hypothetical protein